MAQYSFTVNGSDAVVRVALSWLANVDMYSLNHWGTESPEGVSLANLDLTVKDPNEVIVGTAADLLNNLEVVMFSPGGVGGTYTIEVKLTTQSLDGNNVPQIIYYGVAWW